MTASEQSEDPAAEAAQPYPSEALAWITVSILVLLSIVAYLDRQIVSLMVEMIKATFKVSDSQVGLLQGAAFSLVYAFAAIPFGYGADRGSRRVTLFLGVFFWAVAACICGLANSFNVLLAARVGVGLGEAALTPVVTSLLGDLFPEHRRALAFSVVSVGALVGVNGALVIGGAVLHWAAKGMVAPVLGYLAPWKLAFLMTGLPGLVLAFVIFLIPEPKRRVPIRKTGSAGVGADTSRYISENWAFLFYYLGGFTCLGVATYGLMSWTPVVLQRLYGWSPAQSGLIAGSLTAVCGVIGTLSVGAIVDVVYRGGWRDAHALIYVVAGLLITVCGAACAFAGSPWAFLLLILPTKLVSNFPGVALAGLSLMSPAHLRGRVAALYALTISAAGAAIGPSSVAFFTDVVFRDESRVQWSIAANMVLFGLLGTILLHLARSPMRRGAKTAARGPFVASPAAVGVGEV